MLALKLRTCQLVTFLIFVRDNMANLLVNFYVCFLSPRLFLSDLGKLNSSNLFSFCIYSYLIFLGLNPLAS